MSHNSYITAFTFLLAAISYGIPYSPLHAEVAPRFNNDNWYTLPHPKVAEFSIEEDGTVVGFTENGITFTQYNVPNSYGIRVQRFEIEDHYHYIVEGEIADSFAELSILLSNAYIEQSAT